MDYEGIGIIGAKLVRFYLIEQKLGKMEDGK
jgi:hypothetical protein